MASKKKWKRISIFFRQRNEKQLEVISELHIAATNDQQTITHLRHELEKSKEAEIKQSGYQKKQSASLQ